MGRSRTILRWTHNLIIFTGLKILLQLFHVQAIEAENPTLPTFSGDFFPYSDVYLSARPAYWTGFYGTRPYWKKFYRDTEAHMRSAEILYSYANNLAAGDPVMSVVSGTDTWSE